MTRDLEGFDGGAALAREASEKHFPVRGGHMCPGVGFVIGLEACARR